MKIPQYLIPVFLLLLLALSCEKEDTIELNTDYRIKTILEYQNDIPVEKTIYSYDENRLDSFRFYENILDPDYYYSYVLKTDYSLSTFEYDGNTYAVQSSSVAGDLILSGGTQEYVFEDGLLIRYNNESYSYEDGLLVERERIFSSTSKTRSTYEYKGDRPVCIITTTYSSIDEDYVNAAKYEYKYTGDSVIADEFGFSRSDQEWILKWRHKYFYSVGQITFQESFLYTYGSVIPYYKSESEYNEQGDVIRVTTENTGKVRVTEYEYTFDDYGNITEKASSDGVVTKRILYYYENGGSNVENFNIPNSPEFYVTSLNPYTNAFK